MKSALGGELFMSNAFENAFGSNLPCRIAFPARFLGNPGIMRVPAARSDLEKVHVADPECWKEPKQFPRTAYVDDRGNVRERATSTYYFFKPDYARKLLPGSGGLKFYMKGVYVEGHLEGPVQLAVDVRKGDSWNRASPEELGLIFAQTPQREMGSTTYMELLAKNTEFYVSNSQAEAALDKDAKYKEFFDVSLALGTERNERISDAEFLRLVSASGDYSKVLVDYSVTPKPGAAEKLKGDKYRIYIQIKIEFEESVTMGGVGSNRQKKILEDVVQIDVERASGFAAKGRRSVGEIAMKSTGRVLFFDIDSDITDMRTFIYVSKFEEIQ